MDFKIRSENNLGNRCLHHHVFDTSLVVQILDYMKFQIKVVEAILPYHIVAIAQKVSSGILPNNQIFSGENAEYKYQSPFISDRK